MMLVLIVVCLLASLLSVSDAVPVDMTPIGHNNAACEFSYRTTKDGTSEGFYKLQIGQAYIKEQDCQSILENLKDKATYIANYKCAGDKDGQLNLSFATAPSPNTNIGIIEALQTTYPTAPFKTQRICLQNGNTAPSSWSDETNAGNIASRNLNKVVPSAPALNTARCTLGSQNSPMGTSDQTYDLYIGRPFINGAGCQPIRDTLNRAGISAGGYTCEAGRGDTTHMSFFVPGAANSLTKNYVVINALQKAYPDVPFQAKRICLFSGALPEGDWP